MRKWKESPCHMESTCMLSLESFRWLRFCFDSDEHTIAFYDSMNSQPVALEIILILDPPCSQEGCFCLGAAIFSSSFAAIVLVPYGGPGFFGSRACGPSTRYALIHLQNVLKDMPRDEAISFGFLLPSLMYRRTARLRSASVPFAMTLLRWSEPS
jgi:hypothetical protein